MTPFIEIKVTVPKEIINVERVRRAIIDAQERRTKPALLKLFGMTVNGWHNRPAFRSRRIDSSSQLGIRVGPEGPDADQWILVNGGARPHIIRPRRARMLRFQPGYRAGTKRRVLQSQAYARSGDFVTAHEVHHPGFEAREFTNEIAEEHQADFEKDMQQAIQDATRK
jgi:hypothetical protein